MLIFVIEQEKRQESDEEFIPANKKLFRRAKNKIVFKIESFKMMHAQAMNAMKENLPLAFDLLTATRVGADKHEATLPIAFNRCNQIPVLQV